MPQFSRLLDGYRRFHAARDAAALARYAELDAQGQRPEIMVIACCDARVDPELIFDVEPGELFVLRNIAALVPPREWADGVNGTVAAIDYAVQTLQVRQIVVLGHSNCGGCEAALGAADPPLPPTVERWVGLLANERADINRLPRPARRLAMEQAAVRRSLANLRTYSEIADREQLRKLTLRGLHFAIADGGLTVADETGRFHPV